ncbi:MAG: hypothetical protein LBD28_03575 [Tannerellaceae bacterium]|nr:hypothetical protein [Tannerellaceae bacterium]
MKTKFFLMISLLSLTLHVVGTTDGYKDSLMVVACRLDTAWNIGSLEECAVELKGFASANPAEWMPVYYAALCNIHIAYVCQSGKEAYFNEARKHIDALKDFPAADASEVATLQAYFYAALTAAYPQTNGRKYYASVISLYDQAMELNPDNPRPICFKSHFSQYLPESLRSDEQIAEGRRKAAELFSREQPSPDKPFWGAFYLNNFKQQ